MARTYTSVADGAAASANTWHASHSITALDQGAKTFSVSGDVTADILAGDSLTVAGSTGNDGTYTVVSAVFASTDTVIVVAEAIVDPIVDGTVRDAEVPETGDSIVVNNAVSVGANLALVGISGSGTLTINSGKVVDAASCSVAAVTLHGTLAGTTTVLQITAGDVTLFDGATLGGNIDVRGTALLHDSSSTSWTMGTVGTIRLLTNQELAALAGTIAGVTEVYATLTLDSAPGGSSDIKLMRPTAMCVVAGLAIRFAEPPTRRRTY